MIRRILRNTGLILALLGAVYILLRGQFHDVLRDLARTQVMNVTSDLINDAIARQIAAGDIHYDRIVYF